MPITNSDPLLGLTAEVFRVESGGFVVRQIASGGVAQNIETYCVNMDAVAQLLALIYTPPA